MENPKEMLTQSPGVIVERRSLEEAEATGVAGYAIFDSSHRYRYVLCRERLGGEKRVCFVMLNPSVADASKDDPTIRRCINFARSWGYGSLVVTNLFAFRATNPNELKPINDPVGPLNDSFLKAASAESDAVVAAWGVHGRLFNRDAAVLKLLRHPIYVIALTGEGLPAHPLYQKSCLPKMKWRA